MATAPPSHSRSSPGLTVLAVVALVVLLLGGAYLILNFGPSGTVPGVGVDYTVLIVVVWFVLISAGIARVTAEWPGMKLPLRATFLVIAIAGSGFYVWDTWLRSKTEADEEIVQVAPAVGEEAAQPPAGEDAPESPGNRALAGGPFEGVDGHDAKGQAMLVEVEGGGQVLTFDEFETDQGPDLRVYLVKGDDVSGGNFIDLGKLKAEKGRFQYELDEQVDPGEYTHVFVWCRAFSVGFGRAELSPS